MSHDIRLPGLVVTEHTFEVPLNHADPDDRRIEVFAREVADPDGRERPFLVYLQGGPGYEAPRPTRHPGNPAFLERALQDFRVLMLDQRGTGRSSPIGTLPGMSPEEQAEYLTHFRADAIVRDAELIRQALGGEPWSVLGQSFGGMSLLTYLSIAPEGLREALITGGIPGLGVHIDEVYTATYARALERNRRYYERYPADRARARALRERMDAGEVVLLSGERMTWRRFRQLGLGLGMSDGAEHLHYLLELPADSPAFLRDAETGVDFARNPIYAILHEASWADGFATRWAAERLLPAEYTDSELFTGEHVYPWMFEDYASLRLLAGAAELLAAHEWPRLYDPDVLASNEVPVAAAIYANDMYLERTFSEQTAARIRGCRVWVTNEYEHNGLRVDGGRILSRLLDMARGRI